MPTYRVWAKRIEYEYLDVEARDEDEANRKAEAAANSGEDMWWWNSVDDIEWEIQLGKTEKIDEDHPRSKHVLQ